MRRQKHLVSRILFLKALFFSHRNYEIPLTQDGENINFSITEARTPLYGLQRYTLTLSEDESSERKLKYLPKWILKIMQNLEKVKNEETLKKIEGKAKNAIMLMKYYTK